MSDGFFESSKSIEEKIQKMRDELVIDPNNLRLQRMFADLLLNHVNRSRLIEASDILKKVLEHDRADLESRILEVRAYRLSNNLPKALQLADELENYYPETPSILEELGRIYLEKNYYQKAEQYLEKAYKMDPSNGRIGRAYCSLFKEKKDYKKFLSVTNLVATKSNDARTIKLQAHALFYNDRQEAAVSLLEEFQKKFPQEFKHKMWDVDGNFIPLSYNLAEAYLDLAIKISERKKIVLTDFEFNENDNVSFILNSDSEIVQLLEKSLNLCDAIILEEEKDGNDFHGDSIYKLKYIALFHLHRFEESLHVVETQMKKFNYHYLFHQGIQNFYLKEYRKSVNFFEKLFLDFPDNPIILQYLRDTYRVLGDKDAYLEKKKKLEILKEKSENKNASPKMKDFSIIPGEDFENHYKVSKFFQSRKGGFLKITDRYMTSDYIKTLADTVNMDEIHEIQIMRGMYHTEAGNQFFNDTVNLPRMIYKFNRTYEDRCKLTVKVANLHASDHDRYAITSDEVYNIPGFTQMDENKSSDGTPITNKEGVLARRSRFEELWNSKDSVILTSDNWTEILEKLSDMVESDKQELANSVKIALDPTLEHADENKAVRDNVPEILKSKGLNLNFETKTDENFIRSMHKKIQEELAEYVLADQNHNKIQKKNRKLESQNAKLQNTADTKMVKALEKSIRGLESDLSKLMGEKHIDPLEELTDIVEAAYRMAELRGCSKEEFEKLRDKRSDEFGRFDKNWYLYKEKENAGQG